MRPGRLSWIRLFAACQYFTACLTGTLGSQNRIVVSTSGGFRDSSTWQNSKTTPFLSTAHEGPELFSMAPMMGHTHRHFRHFFGQISHHAWLYTEMIPASQIVQSFAMAAEGGKDAHRLGNHFLDSEWVVEQTERMRMTHREGDASTIVDPILDELLNPGPNPSVLQLGGRDPCQLANAAAIGAAFGFHSINLNCGCPSTSVTSRATGAAMMREPDLVASCLEAMSIQMDRVNPRTILSVKHRLGVQDAETYNAEWDHAQDDQEAYESCRSFVLAISTASKVSRIQVRAHCSAWSKKCRHAWTIRR